MVRESEGTFEGALLGKTHPHTVDGKVVGVDDIDGALDGKSVGSLLGSEIGASEGVDDGLSDVLGVGSGVAMAWHCLVPPPKLKHSCPPQHGLFLLQACPAQSLLLDTGQSQSASDEHSSSELEQVPLPEGGRLVVGPLEGRRDGRLEGAREGRDEAVLEGRSEGRLEGIWLGEEVGNGIVKSGGTNSFAGVMATLSNIAPTG